MKRLLVLLLALLPCRMAAQVISQAQILAWQLTAVPGNPPGNQIYMYFNSSGQLICLTSTGSNACSGTGGGGNVSNSGTPTANQIAVWVNSTTIQGLNAIPNGITATTQTAGDNTTKIATDAFVLANAGALPSGTQYNPLLNTSGSTTYATSPLFFDTTQATGTDRGAAVHGIWTTGYGSNVVHSIALDMRAEALINDNTHGLITFTTNPLPCTNANSFASGSYGCASADTNYGPTFIIPPAGMQLGASFRLAGDQTFLQGEGPGGTLGSGVQGSFITPNSSAIPSNAGTANGPSSYDPAVCGLGTNAGNILNSLGPYSNRITGFTCDADYYAPSATVQPGAIPFTYFSGQDSNNIDWISVQNGTGVNMEIGGGSSAVAGNGSISQIFSKHTDTSTSINQTATVTSVVISTSTYGSNIALVTYNTTTSTGILSTQNASSGGCSADCAIWASGQKFPWQVGTGGQSITINGTAYTVSASGVISNTLLQLTTAPGTQTNVVYDIGAILPPQPGDGINLTGTSIANLDMTSSDWGEVAAVPSPTTFVTDAVDRNCNTLNITFTSANQFCMRVPSTVATGTHTGLTATAWYKPTGVRWNGGVLSGGKELGPMSISDSGSVNVTTAAAVALDITGDLISGHALHTESHSVGIQIGALGPTRDVTLINPNTTSQLDTGIVISTRSGSNPSSINLLGMAGSNTNSTGATAATVLLNDEPNGNSLTAGTGGNNKYCGFYFTDATGYDLSDCNPVAGTEIANGWDFYNGIFAGYNSGTAEISLNAKTGAATVGALTVTSCSGCGGGTTTNSVTFNNSGSGAASGTAFNGSSAVTVSYNTIGAVANPMTTLGDETYGGASGVFTRLAGPTTPNSVPEFLVDIPSAGAATAESWYLSGVPVDATSPATLLATDRANYIKWASGTALALPAVATTFASNLPFSLQNIEGATLTITPNAGASDLIDGAASGTLLNNFAAFVYQDSTTAPGHWFTIKYPTFAAFGSTCANALTWSTTTGFGCSSSVLAQSGTSDVTGQSGSQSSVTVVTSPAAGNYELHYYADLNTACTTGSNGVTFTFNWTDATAARVYTTGQLTLGTAGSSQYLSGAIPIRIASGNVTYTSTVAGTCLTGSSSYDVHITVTTL